MYKALYRTERPEVFEEVVGQDHIVEILQNQIKTNTVGHAYLFSGTRGTGKTTLARILAKGVNCLSDDKKPCGVCSNCISIKNGTFVDLIEIDAASNNGVENIRELRESVNYPPAAGLKKVYIIDEAHMLSKQALNALLKTLEEPPENVIFVLATTDPQKLLQTILSRCLKLDVRRVSEDDIVKIMKAICEKRNILADEDALSLIAVNADGSVRDALSLLDRCLSGSTSHLDRDSVIEYLGTAGEDFFINLTNYVHGGKIADALVIFDKVMREGKDAKQILSDWLSHYRNILMCKYVDEPEKMLNVSRGNIDKLLKEANSHSLSELNDAILTIANAINDARYSAQPRTLMELAIVKLASENSRGVQSIEPAPFFHKPDMKSPDVNKKEASQDITPADKDAAERINAEERKAKRAMIDETAYSDDRLSTNESSSSGIGSSVELDLRSAQGIAQEEASRQAQIPLQKKDTAYEKYTLSEENIALEQDTLSEENIALEQDTFSQEDIVLEQGSLSKEEVWDRVCRQLKLKNSSVNMLATKTHIIEMNDTSFKIGVPNAVVKNAGERNTKLIEELLEAECGKSLNGYYEIITIEDTDEIVSSIGSKYNVKVRVK